MQQNDGKSKRRRRWYSISVDTLRLSIVPVIAVTVVALGYFAYRSWQSERIEERAREVVAEAGDLFQRLSTREVREGFPTEIEQARGTLEQARSALAARDFEQAVEQGRRSRAILLSIREALGQKDDAGEARFVTVQGTVEYRRAGSGRWQTARRDIVLRSGDQVRTTGGGSAEILFREDGNLTLVLPNTQLVITGNRRGGGSGERSMKMEYGWVNLSTSRHPGSVATPDAEARVEGNSDAFVTYERGSRTGRFGAYRGRMQVTSPSGEERTVDELHEVVQQGDRLSDPRPLPMAPELSAPQDNLELRLEANDRIVLEWSPVEGVSRYALQVSENHLFVNNVVEDPERSRTRATLGVQGEGSFLWRVAALARDGSLGPWSPPRRFRVVSSGRGSEDDRKPPPLELSSITPYGNLYIITGTTEPGATVTINGEPVKVEADGTFMKTIQFTTEGLATIDVRSTDAWGNTATLSQRVRVEGL